MTLHRRLLLAQLAALPFAPEAARASPVVDELWPDAARERTLHVRLRWPATPGPWPVVLFSHGLGGSREGGAAWGEAWARAGLVCLHVQHPGSDTTALREGLQQAMHPLQAVRRAEDVRFVIGEIGRRHAAGQDAWARVRPDRIGVSGHSFGAHTTLAIAGQRYAGVQFSDPRPKAFIAFSPSLPRGSDGRAELAEIRRPLLCVTGTRDEDVVGNGATPERRAAVFDALPAGAKAMLLLQDADHMTFAGQPGRSLPFRRREEAARQLELTHTEIIARVCTDWWLAQLLDDEQARQRLAAPAGLGGGDRWVTG